MGREKMSKCRICKTSVPNWQTFCLHCGARIYIRSVGTQKEGFFARLRISSKNFFRSEEAKKADKHMEYSYAYATLAIYSAEAVLLEHEEAAKLDPKYKSILATSYAAAGNERMSDIYSRFRPIYAWGKEEQRRTVENLTKPVLSAIREMMRVESLDECDAPDDFDAYKALDKEFKGALEMFDKSFETDPDYPGAFWWRASAYTHMAEAILMAYWVYPKRIVDSWSRDPIGSVQDEKMDKVLEHGHRQLGFCDPQMFSGFEFAEEIVWLYERAEEDYQQALGLDPTNARCYIDLSDLVGQLGKLEEASSALNTALSILNKALQGDSSDINTYLERAEVYERLGDVKLAIADLEHTLTLETKEYGLKSVRHRIEALRKMENKS